MTTATDKLRVILARHAEWVGDPATGKHADRQSTYRQDADLTGADLRYADLTGADPRDAGHQHRNRKTKRSNETMTKQELFKVIAKYIEESDYREYGIRVDLSGIDLSGTNLTMADLSNTDLSDADLSGSNLTAAKLSLVYTDLTEDDLSDMVGNTQ